MATSDASNLCSHHVLKVTAYEMTRTVLWEAGLRTDRKDSNHFGVDDAPHRTARLAGYIAGEEKLTKREIKRWQELGIMDTDGRVRIDDVTSGVAWMLIAMVWDGKMQKVNTQ